MSSSNQDETSGLVQSLWRFIDESLPIERVLPVLKAKQHYAAIVDSEAPPAKFLQVYGMDAKKAAEAMISYWQMRVKILGDKAFSPVRDLLDFGSVEEQSKHSMILPFDKVSRSVLFVSGSDVASEEAAKAFFCYSQLVVENPASQKDGFVVIHNLEHGSTEMAVEAATFLSTTLPARVKRYFLVCPKNQRHLTEHKIPEVTRALAACTSHCIKPVVVVAQTAGDLQAQLEQEGLKRQGLPEEIGGSFGPTDLQAWLQKHANTPCSPSSHLAGLMDIVRNTLSNYYGSKKQDGSPPPEKLTAKTKSSVLEMKSNPSDTIPTDPKVALKRIEAAMEFVCEQDRSAFNKAMQKAPHLVETESNPIWYLHAENNNVWSAARRMGCYWRFRMDVFGERAFFPMALHSEVESALEPDAKKLIETGFLCLGPNDRHGRTVVFCSQNRITGTGFETPAYGDTRSRFFFFIMQLVSELDSSRDNGMVFLTDFGDGESTPKMSKHSARTLRCLQLGAFPVEISQSHLVVRPKKTNLSGHLLNAIYPIVAGWNHLMSRTLLHLESDRTKLFSILNGYGFDKKGIHHSVGGTWSFKKDLKLWIDYRIYKESSKYGLSNEFSDLDSKKLTCDEFRKAQKRKMDVVYARRKRQRYRIEVDVLEARAEEYRTNNMAVRVDNEYLEGLLREAQLYELTMLRSGGNAPISSSVNPQNTSLLGQPAMSDRNKLIMQQGESDMRFSYGSFPATRDVKLNRVCK